MVYSRIQEDMKALDKEFDEKRDQIKKDCGRRSLHAVQEHAANVSVACNEID